MINVKEYLDQLIQRSTYDFPAWNIEAIRGGKAAHWNYIDGCMLLAIMEMYRLTADKRYLDFCVNFMHQHMAVDGSIKEIVELKEGQYNIDHINEGKVLFSLLSQTSDERFRSGIESVYACLMKHPRIETGNFWHKSIYPDQVWLDGLYMAMPFYMAYETQFNKFINYKDIFDQFTFVYTTLRNPKTGLYAHGYDHSRQMHWADPETGLSPNVWCRSMGWYVMALVDTLEQMDEQLFYEYRQLMGYLKEALEALLSYQDKSGMWFQLVEFPNLEGNYLETSGSAMIAYALMKGARLGFVAKRFAHYGSKAYEEICARYLRSDGEHFTLGGICLVAGLGGQTKRDGSTAYYLSEPIVENDAKGVAPFLLAYTEWLKIQVVEHDSDT